MFPIGHASMKRALASIRMLPRSVRCSILYSNVTTANKNDSTEHKNQLLLLRSSQKNELSGILQYCTTRRFGIVLQGLCLPIMRPLNHIFVSVDLKSTPVALALLAIRTAGFRARTI